MDIVIVLLSSRDSRTGSARGGARLRESDKLIIALARACPSAQRPTRLSVCGNRGPAAGQGGVNAKQLHNFEKSPLARARPFVVSRARPLPRDPPPVRPSACPPVRCLARKLKNYRPLFSPTRPAGGTRRSPRLTLASEWEAQTGAPRQRARGAVSIETRRRGAGTNRIGSPWRRVGAARRPGGDIIE